ncbi:MAG: bile acid:sodium symporter family protein [Spirochaetaceae bacterium]|jgi:BASS family bile acid:Na+ symporter|nr:bile acid:sodium symporter family protein [Spirochaetaceae bacterium]
MKFLEKLSGVVGKFMAIIVIVIAAAALLTPALNWIKTSWVNTLLGIVMFGMGLTLRLSDFKMVFKRPKDVILGFVAQFTLMPLIAFLLTRIFSLPVELAVGVVLVGTCPGGTSSNVMTYLAKGDVALSVTMTSFSTLLSPLLTPLLTLLYVGQQVDVNVVSMFLSIVKLIIVPIALGLICTRFFSKITKQAAKVLPLISVIAIVMIVAAVVSVNAAKILANGFLIVAVVVLHNIFGYATGFGLAKIFRSKRPKATTIAIEVGMQNSGLATSLALTHFAAMPLAAIPGAVFSVWHNISGSIFANLMVQGNEKINASEAA